MSAVFDAYSRYYDLLYRDKDYIAEAGYVASSIKAHAPGARRVLEFGCGTGIHATELARAGYEVHGFDLSAGMIERANARKLEEAEDIAARLSFARGDIRDVRTERPYDAAISLFHVMSYQTSGIDVKAALSSAYASLLPGGLFFFDFWYGPAVLTQRPDVRIRRLEDDAVKVVRIAEPVLHSDRNVVDVGFTVFVEDKASGDIAQIRETHPMRYFFLPELEELVAPWFDILGVHAWMSARPPDARDWAACVTLKRRN